MGEAKKDKRTKPETKKGKPAVCGCGCIPPKTKSERAYQPRAGESRLSLFAHQDQGRGDFLPSPPIRHVVPFGIALKVAQPPV